MQTENSNRETVDLGRAPTSGAKQQSVKTAIPEIAKFKMFNFTTEMVSRESHDLTMKTIIFWRHGQGVHYYKTHSRVIEAALNELQPPCCSTNMSSRHLKQVSAKIKLQKMKPARR